MWREFDIGEVRDDMAQIASIGFDVVRFFALTRDFLPGPMSVAPEMIARLEQVALAARDAGIKSMPTLITINMSGRFWWPSWMLDGRGVPADLFSDPAILRSQALLVDTCARALSGDDSIRAFDLSNEIDDAQRPLTRDAGWLWASLLANTIRRAAPGTPVQIGAHLLSLTTPEYLRIDDLAGVADDDVMHAYPLYTKTARSFLDPELVPFSCALTGPRGQSTTDADAGVRIVHGSAGIAGRYDHRRLPGIASLAVSRFGRGGSDLLQRSAREIVLDRCLRCVRVVSRRLR